MDRVVLILVLLVVAIGLDLSCGFMVDADTTAAKDDMSTYDSMDALLEAGWVID